LENTLSNKGLNLYNLSGYKYADLTNYAQAAVLRRKYIDHLDIKNNCHYCDSGCRNHADRVEEMEVLLNKNKRWQKILQTRQTRQNKKKTNKESNLSEEEFFSEGYTTIPPSSSDEERKDSESDEERKDSESDKERKDSESDDDSEVDLTAILQRRNGGRKKTRRKRKTRRKKKIRKKKKKRKKPESKLINR